MRFGRIERIDPVLLDGDHHLGVGMVVRAVAGGVRQGTNSAAHREGRASYTPVRVCLLPS